MSDGLLNPRNLASAVAFDRARELFDVLRTADDPDEIGDAIEAAASDADLAQAVIFQLVVFARWNDEGETRTGVELVANAMNAPGQLWRPPT
jgi:hypothetical protein